jgi:hypothetical protein
MKSHGRRPALLDPWKLATRWALFLPKPDANFGCLPSVAVRLDMLF